MTRVLGDYNIIKQIGQGSLGTVFLAEHRFMKRPYVLKVLPEELSSDRGFIQRFKEEVGRLSTLDHPNIVKIHNVSFAQGTYFLVTDCVVDPIGESTNLAQYLASIDGAIKEEQLLLFLQQLADALDYAHSSPLIHRGLKLNNVLVGEEGGKPKLFISDFGLSRIIGVGNVLNRIYKVLGDALAVVPVMTGSAAEPDRYSDQPGDSKRLSKLHASFLQSYAFLAPEQKQLSDAPKVTREADVYAFGVLAYYLMTKEFPEGVFEMPSTRGYKMNWDLLVCRCLQANPQKRPASLKEILNRIVKKGEVITPRTAPERVPLVIPVESQPQSQPQLQPQSQPQLQPQSQPQLQPQRQTIQREELQPVRPQHQVAINQEPEPEPEHKLEFAMAAEPNLQRASLKPMLYEQEIERPHYDPDPAEALQVDGTVKHYNPEPNIIKHVEPILTDMVVVKGGEFSRGSNEGNRDEMPLHQITLMSFALDIHPITNEQFVRFLGVMGGEKDSNNQDIIRLRESRINRRGGKISIESGYAKHPVVGVTWYGAVAYAKWIGKRLPTEAEWEIAARGGAVNSMYPCGDNVEKKLANFFSSDTTAVMSYNPNGSGLFDMSGNVYEWCQDWYGYNYYETSAQEPDNPKGPIQGVYRVLRGGCWKSLKDDLRCSHRHRNNPGTVNRTYGFRCATDVQ